MGQFQLDAGGQSLLAGTGCATFYTDAARTAPATGLIVSGAYFVPDGEIRLVFNQLDGATVHDYRHRFLSDHDVINIKPRPSGDQSATDLSKPTWDDLRVSLSTAKAGGAGVPTYSVFRDGVYAWAFSKAATEYLLFEVQLPHSWIAGTSIRPHVHWSPGVSTDTGSVRWALEYTWANAVATPGNTFPATTTLTADQAAAGTAYSHQIAELGTIAGTGMRLSSVLLCKLARVGGATEDTFDASAFGVSVDFHIQGRIYGSDDEYPTS